MGLIDNHSLENAILCKQSPKWPLMIDPQKLAKSWILKAERENKLVHVMFDAPELLKKITTCVEHGIPMLIEISETLDSSLDALLLKQTSISNGKQMIRIGEKTIAFHENFRLYITR
jgi:dynein heavy chain